MENPKPDSLSLEDLEVIQTSITMERHLKARYAKLAVTLDLSFSQLVRYALRRVDEGEDDYNSINKQSAQHPPDHQI